MNFRMACRVSSSFQKGRLGKPLLIPRICSEHQTRALATIVLLAATVVVCSLLESGCVFKSFITKSKTSADEKTAGSPQSEKPSAGREQAAQTPKTAPTAAQPPAGKSSSESPTRRTGQDGTESNRVASKDKEQEQKQKAAGSVGEKTSETARATGTSDDTEDGEPPSASGEPLEKHDHAKYVERIKKKAMEQISRERPCTNARLCMNPVTEEWSLTLYYQEDKSFFLVTYSWDPIDEKWDKSLVSGKRPMAQWDHHVRFSSAGKECENLKGDRR